LSKTIFVRDMIARYEDSARKAGVLIIHSVGCDSIPYDLTTFEAAREMERATGKSRQMARVRTSMQATGAAVSGGTFATMLEGLAAPREQMQIVFDKYMLSPKKGKQTVRGPILWASEPQGYGGFWVIAAHNDAIVQRTWGVLEQEHDADPSAFSYGESIDVGNFLGLRDPISPLLLGGVMTILGTAAMLPPVRWALQRFGPQSGDGPSDATRERARTTWTTVASSVDKQTLVQSTLFGKSDAGYGLTSIMAVESALALVLNSNELPSRSKKGGFSTTALALGSVIGKRLVDTGMFTLETRTLKGDSARL